MKQGPYPEFVAGEPWDFVGDMEDGLGAALPDGTKAQLCVSVLGVNQQLGGDLTTAQVADGDVTYCRAHYQDDPGLGVGVYPYQWWSILPGGGATPNGQFYGEITVVPSRRPADA